MCSCVIFLMNEMDWEEKKPVKNKEKQVEERKQLPHNLIILIREKVLHS